MQIDGNPLLLRLFPSIKRYYEIVHEVYAKKCKKSDSISKLATEKMFKLKFENTMKPTFVGDVEVEFTQSAERVVK